MADLMRRALWSAEVEQSVLGAVMVDDDCLPELMAEGLAVDAFYDRRHGEIFQAVCAVADRNQLVDIVTVAEQLEGVGRLAAVGGAGYLSQLVDVTPSADNAQAYARMLLDYTTERRFYLASQEVQRILLEGDYADHAARIADVQQVLTDTERQERSSKVVELRNALKQVMQYVDEKSRGVAPTGLMTGFEYIDSRLGGLESGDLVIIAGRPSMGKTAYALNVARHQQLAGKTGLIFSLEMSVKAQAMRLIGATAKVKLGLIKSGKVIDLDEQTSKFAAGVTSLTNSPGKLFFDDEPSLPITELVARAKRLHRKSPLDYVMVDHIGLVESTLKTEQSSLRVGQISRMLKKLAKDLGCPVIALAQVNRECEKRANKRPINSDLRDSGSIEQDADVIQFVYRDEYYNENTQSPGQLEIISGKLREGETGTDYLSFQGSYGLIEDMKHQPREDESAASSQPWRPA